MYVLEQVGTSKPPELPSMAFLEQRSSIGSCRRRTGAQARISSSASTRALSLFYNLSAHSFRTPRLWVPPSALLGDQHLVSSILTSLRCAHDLTSSCDAHCRTYHPGICALAGCIGGYVRSCFRAVVLGGSIIIIIIIWRDGNRIH
jgi:hypothetical protein